MRYILESVSSTDQLENKLNKVPDGYKLHSYSPVVIGSNVYYTIVWEKE